MNPIEEENQQILEEQVKEAYWISLFVMKGFTSKFEKLLDNLAQIKQKNKEELLKELSKKYKKCSKHFYYNLKAKDLSKQIGGLDGCIKEEYLSIAMWAHKKFPYAGHQNTIKTEKGECWEVYCPICRFNHISIMAITFPYWALK